jgi:hypothetical protein
VVLAHPMVTAYFDESYNHPKDGSTEPAIYTVACYFGLRENWDAFRGEWNVALREKGLETYRLSYEQVRVGSKRSNQSKGQF